MPTVSIAMCTYNGAAYVVPQLQSIAAQERVPDEVIVCDDASKDDTVARVEEFQRTSRLNIRVCRSERNLGYVANFNRALSEASGDIVFLADQDDVWKPHKVDRMLREFERAPAPLLVYSDLDLVDGALHPLGSTLWQLLRFDPSAHDDLRGAAGLALALNRGNLFCGCSMAVSREFLNVLLPIPAGFPHDLWIGVLAVAADRVALIKEPLMQYRQHAAQTSGAKKPGWRALIAKRWKALQYFRGPKHYDRWALEHELLLDRVETHNLGESSVRLALRDKLSYLQAQARIQRASLPGRVPLLYQEVRSGRYARFGLGWKNLVVDILPRRL